MNIKDLEKLYAATPQLTELKKKFADGRERNILIEGLKASAAPLVFATLARKSHPTILFILPDEDEAGYFYHDLMQIMGEQAVLFFPSSFRGTGKHSRRDAANEILRTEVLSRLSSLQSVSANEMTTLYVITFPEAVAEKVVAKKRLDGKMLTMRTGQTIDVTQVVKTFRDLGLQEVDYVYEPGQFALRGSILDVFSFSCEYPFRIDFFGDDIDSIRTFDVDTQLSRDRRDWVEIVPELEAEEREGVGLAEYLPDVALIATKGIGYIADVVRKTYSKTDDELKHEFSDGDSFLKSISRLRAIDIAGHGSKAVDFDITSQPLFHKNFEMLRQSLKEYVDKGYQIYILADSRKQSERLREILPSVAFIAVDKTLHEGFVDNGIKACFFTDHQIFDRFHKYNLRSDKARSGKVALTLKEIKQFEIGDYVVHIDHGIGKFGGLVRMPQGDSYQEMIKIIYQNGDSIYVSIHSLYKVSKYKAQDNGEPPKLSHLGTGQWERMKERTKKKLKDIARDLIRLYAARRKEKGFAFSPDNYMQHELEAGFLYEDTPDQLKATSEVKADMESDKPMDRLVCGDVGFGKTEVAVRAAFKAACDSKQVAVLVPTTVLAYQHYQTFSRRLRDFPVRVDYLTRAKGAKQTKQVLEDLREGKIDIIIGTHKLIGKSVRFKDLGLLIIDEEQKFGVATKEKLRQMKVNIDTLTMTATPIPRTLQFSLLGARDMSVIQTPPPNRYPIHTEICTFDAEIIAEAIRFEMNRNGQVFFVNNKISDLPHLEQLIRKYVPEARVAIGHGQMDPEQLEEIMLGFSNYDYDVLLSTTIVENGLDIPNANTIIINGAHNFGLSDLHQMRGRVGRSNRKAYCYLLAPPLAALNPESRKRLEALENFSDLGSGINIAMQDLDIRGAGNLLGAEQSGFIADVGYETYVKILNQAVTELKNDEFPQLYGERKETSRNDMSGEEFVDDCSLESDIEMYFPDHFVPKDSERMMLYRELDNMRDERELDGYRKRLRDRFGEIPQVAEELILVVPLRKLGRKLGCERLIMKQGRMTLVFVSNPNSPYYQSNTFGKVIEFISNNPRRCNLKDVKDTRSMVVDNVSTVKEGLSVLESILSK